MSRPTSGVYSTSVDLDIDIEMPETPANRSKGPKVSASKMKQKISRPKSGHDQSVSGTSWDKKDKQTDRRTHTAKTERQREDESIKLMQDDNEKEEESSDPEEKLSSYLVSHLTDCSRQRLRALHMSLRHYGNVDNRVTFKDMQSALQENQIKVSSRALQMMGELFEDAQGIDYERLYLCMGRAHLKTGRDSVKARSKRNDNESKNVMTLEDMDNNFITRLEDLLIKDQTFFDLDFLRDEFAKWDQNRVGKMNKEGASLICSEKTPLYGALLKNLINRCDEDKDGKISWPLFLNFLEKAQTSVWEKHPELSTLPEKARESAAVRIATPEPIDELSSSTKTMVMSRLMRKTFSRRNSAAEGSNESSNQKPNSKLKSSIPTNEQQLPDPTVEKGDNCDPEDKDGQSKGENNGRNKHTKKDDEKMKDTENMPTDKTDLDGELSSPTQPHEQAKSGKISPHDVTAVVPRGYQAPDSNSDPPSERLQLEWVYGYRGNDCSCNLHLLASGEVVYFMAYTVIIYKQDTHTQRHYMEHTENIKCLSVHSGGMLVASGQFASKDGHGAKAHVRVWRSDTLQTLHVLGEGHFSKCVLMTCFMPGQDILACADNSQEKKLMIWDTNEGKLIAQTLIATEVLCSMGFNPKYPELLVTCGKEHLAWFKIYLESKRIQPSAMADYDNFMKARYINCLTHNTKGDLITGDSNGTVYVWANGGNSITNLIKHGHEGPVLDVLPVKHHLLTSGKDGKLNCWAWNRHMDKDGTLQLPRSEGAIRRQLLVTSPDGQGGPVLFLGTSMNSLLYVTLNHSGSPLDGVALENVPITQGHTEELRAISPIRQSFVGADIITASTDGMICKLTSEKKLPVWKLWLSGCSFACVDASREGDLLVMGTKDGHLVVLQVSQEDMVVVELLNKKTSTSVINTVKLSPDERMLAVGGSDKTIQIYILLPVEGKGGADEVWTYYGKCKGHAGYVHAIDWSSNKLENSYILRSSSSMPEQKFWNVTSCQELNGEDLNDISWSSTNCILDHTLIGLWKSKQASESHVTCVDVSPNKSLVAMATSEGALSLFRYPCNSERSFSHAYRSHRHTHNLCFTPNGKSLFTVGGPDVCIMQWRLV